MRKSKHWTKVADIVGAVFFLIGLGGLGGACEGRGSFLLSAIIFAIGFGLSFARWSKK